MSPSKSKNVGVFFTFVGSGVMTIVRAPITLRGIQGGAGRSVSHLGGGDLRNVVVPERVSVKLHIHHLEELQLISTRSVCGEASLTGDSADVRHLQFLLQVSAAQCTFCPAMGK